MSSNEQESRFQVNYSLEDTFQALQSAIEKLEGFETVGLDAEQHSIHLKAQSALFSSVEELTITVSNCDNQSAAVTILTVPNPTGALLNNVRPPEKRRNHLREIMGALNNETAQLSTDGSFAKEGDSLYVLLSLLRPEISGRQGIRRSEH